MCDKVALSPELARIPSDWPNRSFSRSVRAGALDWHVQVAGRGPTVVLLHGTGSSAHSWADVFPALAENATVVAPDLPGHGYTTGADLTSLTLPRIAAQLDALLATLDVGVPSLVVGHSAGAALALRWALDKPDRRFSILGFNPSLVAPPAIYTRVLGPLVAPLFTSSAMSSMVRIIMARTSALDSMLKSTGSSIPDLQRSRYAVLLENPLHIRGATAFMAAADLPAIEREAQRLTSPLTFVVGKGDLWVREKPLLAVINRAFQKAKVWRWEGGHLLHEEQPARAVALIRQELAASPR